jgi:hypothetical protein
MRTICSSRYALLVEKIRSHDPAATGMPAAQEEKDGEISTLGPRCSFKAGFFLI